MPPKADAKGKKGTTKASKKEIDKTLYVRKPISIATDKQDINPIPEFVTGIVSNVELLIPEWDIATENWSEPPPLDAAIEGGSGIKYPLNILPQSVYESTPTPVAHKSIIAFLGLDAEVAVADPKAKGAKKPDTKKGGTVSSEILDEVAFDETGRKMPRVYIEKDNTDYKSYKISMETMFRRDYSAEQLERRSYQEALKAATSVSDQTLAGGLSEEDITKLKEDAQKAYDDAILIRDVDKELPDGNERDPYICSAFKYVARYAPALFEAKMNRTSADVTSSLELGDSGMEYLWNSIYPKLPSGRPCYNQAGRYCIRLFLGGKWRKVIVSDEIPVDSNGIPIIASSTDPYELWPSLLAKGLYSVYNTCGYHKILPDINNISNSFNNSIVTGSVASFVGFCIHALTGWTPNTSWHVQTTIECDYQRAKPLMDEILYGGALKLNEADIPNKIPTLDLAAVTEGGSLKTKNQFKEEYLNRIRDREYAVEQIQKRESQIQSITNGLLQSFTENFAVCTYNIKSNCVEILPILAVATGSYGDDIKDAKLLVEWEIVETVTEADTARMAKEAALKNELTPYLNDLDMPLPSSTVLKSRWINMCDLMYSSSNILGFDTLISLPHQQSLSWHWKPSSDTVIGSSDKGKDGKGKDSKGKDVAVLAPAGRGECIEPGELPPTLLSIDTASFFSLKQNTAAAAAASVTNGLTEEEAAAIQAQQSEMDQIPQSIAEASVKEPKASHLSISVFVHGDMIESNNTTDGLCRSNIVLVLQEINLHSSCIALEPLVMRVELSKNAHIPYTRVTFHIPYDRVDADKPLLLWMRLFTKASVHVSFGCSVGISVGSADQVWQNLGYKALIKEGEVGATPPGTEQLLFRAPLQLDDTSSDNSENALIYLHISNSIVASAVSLMLGCDKRSDVEGESTCILPRLQGSTVVLYSSPSRVKSLIARCYPLQACKSVLPPFAWKLLVLSVHSIIDPVKPIACEPVTQRYGGVYYPNNKHVILRDVIAVDKQTFPLAVRLSLSSLDEAAVSNSEETTESLDAPTVEASIIIERQVHFVTKLYRYSDRKLVSEFYSRSQVHLYDIRIGDFLADGEVEPAYVAVAAVDAKGGKAPAKKDDKKGGKGTGSNTDECVKILIEVSLDQSKMTVPFGWFSKVPFVYDEMMATVAAANTTSLSYPSTPLFKWSMDVLAGNVIELSHDTFHLERYASMKNDWEDTAEGRLEKATAASAYYVDKKKSYIVVGATGDDTSNAATNASSIVSDLALDQLAVALEKEVGVLKEREAMLMSTQRFTEYIDDSDCNSSDGLPTYLDASCIDEAKAIRNNLCEESDAYAKKVSTLLTSFCEVLREKTLSNVSLLQDDAINHNELLGEIWKERENYRMYADKMNAGLKFILSKAATAVQTCLDAEDLEANPGKKPAKKK